MPTATPTELPTQPPTAGPPATPTATESTQPPIAISELHWREIGPLGEPGRIYSELDEMEALIGFARGYVGVHKVVDAEFNHQDRLWFSADGQSWQDYGLIPAEDEVRAVGTNGDSVVMLVRKGDSTTEAWVSDNGLDWRTAEIGSPELTADPVPRAVWPREGGWHAAMVETYEENCDSPYGCSQGALWTSADGLSWQRLGTIDIGDPVAGLTAADGTVLIQSDFLLESADDGHTWDRVEIPRHCFEPYSPNFLVAHAPIDNVLIFGGGSNVCWADAGLVTWHRTALPTTSILEQARSTLIQTTLGLIAAAPRDCYEPACPPFVEQFVSVDGTSWLSLAEPTLEMRTAMRLNLVDGPGGAFGLASFGVPGGREMRVFQLVAESP